jgi:hypothetical protein
MKVVKIELLPHVARGATQLARASEQKLSRWIAEIVETHVADARCQHRPATPAPPPPEPESEE